MAGPKTVEKTELSTKLKYKHAIQLANMVQPYIKDFQKLQVEVKNSVEYDEDGNRITDESAFGMKMFEMLLVKAPEDLTKFLASVMDVSEEDVQEVGISELLEWFDETWEKNNIPGFIERVQGLMSSTSQSQLQNLSNVSTVGQTQN